MLPAKRPHCLTIGELRVNYEDSLDALNRILAEDPIEIGDVQGLECLTGDVKKILQQFSNAAKLLIGRCINVGFLAEAQTLRLSSMQINLKCKQFMNLISKVRAQHGADSLSNVDTLSLLSFSSKTAEDEQSNDALYTKKTFFT